VVEKTQNGTLTILGFFRIRCFFLGFGQPNPCFDHVHQRGARLTVGRPCGKLGASGRVFSVQFGLRFQHTSSIAAARHPATRRDDAVARKVLRARARIYRSNSNRSPSDEPAKSIDHSPRSKPRNRRSLIGIECRVGAAVCSHAKELSGTVRPESSGCGERIDGGPFSLNMKLVGPNPERGKARTRAQDRGRGSVWIEHHLPSSAIPF
jgi:hypothetical protein